MICQNRKQNVPDFLVIGIENINFNIFAIGTSFQIGNPVADMKFRSKNNLGTHSIVRLIYIDDGLVDPIDGLIKWWVEIYIDTLIKIWLDGWMNRWIEKGGRLLDSILSESLSICQ